jgi:hypothetical protein
MAGNRVAIKNIAARDSSPHVDVGADETPIEDDQFAHDCLMLLSKELAKVLTWDRVAHTLITQSEKFGQIFRADVWKDHPLPVGPRAFRLICWSVTGRADDIGGTVISGGVRKPLGPEK